MGLGIISIYMNIKFLYPGDWSDHAGLSVSASGAHVLSFPKLSAEEGRQHILSVFREAGVELDAETIAKLPTWEEVQNAVGSGPHIYGLDQCPAFRDKVPAIERMLGSSGMFNTGTNLVTHLLKQNCQIPERVEIYGPKATREQWGMRWQVRAENECDVMIFVRCQSTIAQRCTLFSFIPIKVPWGKHTPAKYRLAHATEKAAKINKEWIMPIVTIR